MKKIFLLAGEESGLVYARHLASEITTCAGEEVQFRTYADFGFKSHDLAVMGILPVLLHLFYFMRVARTLKTAIRTEHPDAVVTIDYPGMNLSLAQYAKSLGIPSVHLVCPQVWAWKRGRIPKIAQALTRLLCFFPFEPALFRNVGHPGNFEAHFMGHPMLDLFAHATTTQPAVSIPWQTSRRVALLPGSRKGEIERILPRLVEASRILKTRLGKLSFVIPASSPRARHQIDAYLAKNPCDSIRVVDGRAQEVLRTAEVAAVASGTATLEAALAHVPTVLVFATTPSFAWFLRYFVTGVRFAGLINIIAERTSYPNGDPPKRRPGEGPGKGGPMPELLQEAFTPDALADILTSWLSDKTAAKAQIARTDAVLATLRGGEGHVSALSLAAREILHLMH